MTSIVDKVRPLCSQTEKLLRPVDLHENDRLRISIDGDLKKFTLRPFSVGDSRIPSYHASTSHWGARFPERFVNSVNGYFQVPATDISALIIASVWDRSRLVFDDDDAQTVFDYLLLTFTSELHRAEMQARYKATGEVTGYRQEWIDQEREPLMPYQRQAVACSLGAEGFGLLKEQGTGKTYTAIRRIDIESQLRENKSRSYRVLVVAPKNVRSNWETEIERFSTTNDRHVSVLRGGKIARFKQLVEALSARVDLTYVIVSYECMGIMQASLSTIEWDMIVLDESHFIKSNYAKRTKQAITLRDCAAKRMVLTGTAICNHVGDLFWQLEFLRGGGSGMTTYEAFKRFYLKMYDVNKHLNIVTGTQNVPLLQERLARCAFIMRKEEALKDLPPKVYDVREVEMTKEQQDVYNRIAEDLRVEIEADLASDERSLTINNVLVKLLRLAQVTSGFLSYDPIMEIDEEADKIITERVIDRFDPNPKLEELISLIHEDEITSKKIVWAHFVQDIKSISARLTLEGIDHVVIYGAVKDKDREEAIRRFNTDPLCQVLVANAAVAGTGLNLLGNADDETACDHSIYYSQDFSMVKRAQSEDRNHRRGTKRRVRVTDLVVPLTIDAEIRDRVVNKRVSAYKLQDIRNILHRILEI